MFFIMDMSVCVDLVTWDNLRPGNGYRSRRRGGYLLVLQKPPLLVIIDGAKVKGRGPRHFWRAFMRPSRRVRRRAPR